MPLVVLFSDGWKRLICVIIKIVIMILVSRVVRSSHSEQGLPYLYHQKNSDNDSCVHVLSGPVTRSRDSPARNCSSKPACLRCRFLSFYIHPVLRIWDVYPGSRIRNFPFLDSDPRKRILSIFNPKICF